MQLFETRPNRPGYRLHRLEVFNWGTFDSMRGQVFRFDPQGRTSLLVGHNGSGKSTLVDAITTLLVDTRSRSYNVAAGAKRSERNAKSYIKGAYDRTTDESQLSVVQYLRPKGNHLSAISAVFHDEQLNKSFTLLQVLFLRTDGSDDKVYAIADTAHELESDLNGLRKSDAIKEHLKTIGYQTTKTYVEYLGWLKKRTGMRSKAVDMFNQTVAVKDIQSLNEFIRKHMLESQNWREKIDRLLTHFNDLSVAHQELIRARKQVDLLLPVEKLGSRYRKLEEQLSQLDSQLEAASTFFQHQFIGLFQPEIDKQRVNVDTMNDAIAKYDVELKKQREAIRQLQNEIDQAGGDRLKQLPRLIETENERLQRKTENSTRFHEFLSACQIKETVSSVEQFQKAREHLATVAERARVKVVDLKSQYERAIGTRAGVLDQLKEERRELEVLQQRRTNLPPRFTAMRNQICAGLNLDESALPFAGELIAVITEESRWEASVELVLNSFALSLLVPDRYYQRVRGYVERNRINDDKGHGSRIDYIRVGKASENAGDRIHPNSLFRKLKFRQHEFAPWIKGEIIRRFDFRCCETVEEFNEIPRLALTENRHVKFNAELHKKDDRRKTVDPRYFVLGWDNTEKKRRIEKNIDELQSEANSLTRSINDHDRLIAEQADTARAAADAMKVTDFDSIDYKRHKVEISALEKERRELEESNEAVKTLRKRLRAAESAEEKLETAQKKQIEQKGALESEIERLAVNVQSARSDVQRAKEQGVFEQYSCEFDSITDSLGDPMLTIEDFGTRRQQWEFATRQQAAKLRAPVQEMGEKLVNAMAKFLKEFKEESDDLDASILSLESFMGLLDQLRREDLPKHERKFKERLNDEVTKEVALFNTSLREERKDIEGKIELLNKALASVEYDQQRGTYMRLDPRPVKDREIDDFRMSLRGCLDESLDSSDGANETRFHRIKALVERLGDKDRTTWRNRVIDVRNWYDFAALEIERESGETRSCYDGSSGQSGGEKAKLAFTILVAALAYQFDVDPAPGRFQFVVVDEMFSKVDDQNACYALQLFKQFGLQLLIVAPLDAKARVTEPFVNRYLHVVKDAKSQRSQLFSMTAQEYEEVVNEFAPSSSGKSKRRSVAK
ncbi:MAG: ATP-binding protein [Planctomycetota bacterium]